MSLHLGRITLNEPTNWSTSGTTDGGWQVTVTGSYKATSITDGLIKRDQILGLSNNWDELVIPVIMDGEPRVTGYYRVLSSSCDTDEFVRLQGNLYDYQVTLAPVQGFTNPLLESVISGALLTNAVTGLLTDVHAFHAVPSAAKEYSYAGVSSVFNTRTGADGGLIFLDTGQILSSTAQYGVAPESFYVGAATIEQGGSPSYSTTILRNAPVGYWRAGEGSGNLLDSSGNGNAAVPSGTATYSKAGALIDDSNTAVATPAGAFFNVPVTALDISNNKPYSFEAWINPTTVDAVVRRQIGIEQAGNKGSNFNITNTGIAFRRSDAAAAVDFITGPIPVVGTWVHYVGTYDGVTMRLYVNGVQQGTGVASSRLCAPGAGTFQIGASGGTNNGDSTFDEVAIYPVALSAAQVLADYQVGTATGRLQSIVGRNLQPDTVNWRLSNGLVRMTPNTSVGKLDVSHYTGAVWAAPKAYAISAIYTPTAIADRDSETITSTGTPHYEIGAIASFKSSTTIARVGALGAFTTGTASSVSPTFGQATTGGNLLIAWVSAGNTGTGTAAGGWVAAQLVSGGTGQCAIWYKPNCGAGETAPTFTATAGGASPMYAQLAEFSGAVTVSPVDKIGSGSSFTPTVTLNTSGVDAVATDLVVTATHWDLTNAATASFVAAYNNATAVAAGNSGAASTKGHANHSYGIIGGPIPVTFTGINSLTVLRNSVEETSIRLSLATSVGATAGIITADLSLRRGDRLVRLYLQSTNLSLTFKLARDSTEAATAITYGTVTLGGIRATTNDGDGNRYILLSVQRASPVNDLVNGAITQGAAGLMADYAIGSEVGGSTATFGLDDATTVAKQYLAAQSESQHIVAR